MSEFLELKAITVDERLQCREELHPDTCEDYAEVLRNGKTFDGPPPVVFRDETGTNWLADGFHRYKAHELTGQATMQVDVRPGTFTDALRCACGANANHGKPRTNADKRKAVEKFLEHSPPDISTAEVASVCNVSRPAAERYRKDYEAAHNITRPATVRGRDGVVQQVRHYDVHTNPDEEKHPGSDEGKNDTRPVVVVAEGNQQEALTVEPEPVTVPVDDWPISTTKKAAVEPEPVPTDDMPRDAKGQVIPDDLRTTFSTGNGIPKVIATLEQLQAKFEADTFAFVAGPSVALLLMNVRATIEGGRPGAVCPACKGTKFIGDGDECHVCRSHGKAQGWLPEHAWNEALRRLKPIAPTANEIQPMQEEQYTAQPQADGIQWDDITATADELREAENWRNDTTEEEPCF